MNVALELGIRPLEGLPGLLLETAYSIVLDQRRMAEVYKTVVIATAAAGGDVSKPLAELTSALFPYLESVEEKFKQRVSEQLEKYSDKVFKFRPLLRRTKSFKEFMERRKR